MSAHRHKRAPQRRHRTAPATLCAAALASALLAGCAGVTPDHGFAGVADSTRERIGATPRLAQDAAAAQELQEIVRAELAAPLTMDGAVRVALINNPGLQATYWNVGIAQAELAQASRLPNPALGFQRVSGQGEVEIERGLNVNLAAVLTAPLAARLEARRFDAVRREVGAAIERHALETRRAWIEAVAAQQSLDYARRVHAAAEASAELAARMRGAGNIAGLDLAREQAFQADAAAALARSGRQVTAAREKLTRLLGLWGQDTQYTLPERLPDLPDAPAELRDVERLALARRLDVQAAKADAEATAASLGLSRTTRFVNVLELGYAGKSERSAPSMRGYALSLELPLFDWGGARVARAEATYMQALQRVADTAVTARSEARESYLDYRSAYDLAAHYRDSVIPLRKRISHEVLLRYNGMLASTQALLADSREQAGAVNAYIDALRDFWSAQAALQAALGDRIDMPGAQPMPPAANRHEDHQ
ncbi:TolC family protein [Massilia forsythiae]|uniref:TolC family protein n=1 Tax=Massilia forsythiae TaxID=2728020 RepID=A0A7Z2W0W9_9BURK|nr:TolC family protein [Massilia forsythiae]QJE02748.1 TolC family protein [Massilia forsythiae]